MTDAPHVPFADASSLSPEVLGDIWSDVTGKVTEKAVDSINKAIKDQLGDVGGAILGPVVTKGMAALVGALGLDGGTSESDLDKVMGELAKVKDTLAQMQGELRKIESAIKAVGDLVMRESERINQAAKYRDYLAARESIDAMWTTVWSLLIGVAAHPGDKGAIRSARTLYNNQTVNFIRDTLAATANLKNAVLKMFGDRESLFLHMSKESQPLVREAILNEVAGGIAADGFTLLQRKKGEVWKALLAGPCGDVLKDMKSYQGSGLDGRSGALTRFWYGESWFIFMETARAAVAHQISVSSLSIFLAEINTAFSRAMIILAIMYGRNAGLTTAANKVIETLDEVATEANPRYTEFITSLIAWVGSPGTWGISPAGKRPSADRMQLFGLWAANWMDTSTDLAYPCTYAVDPQGRTYPASLFVNLPDIRRVAETIWNNPTAMNFVYEKKGDHGFGYRYQGFAELGPPLEKWARQNAEGRLPMVMTYPKLPPV